MYSPTLNLACSKTLSASRRFASKWRLSVVNKSTNSPTLLKVRAGGLAYITYQDGEAKSPIAKFLSEIELASIQQKTGAVDGDAVFFSADTRLVVY